MKDFSPERAYGTCSHPFHTRLSTYVVKGNVLGITGGDKKSEG